MTMMPCSEVKALIRDLFEEEALALGGLVALHDVEDDLVWRLVRTMDVVRARVIRRLEDEARVKNPEHTDASIKPHPAIEEFLIRLREEEK